MKQKENIWSKYDKTNSYSIFLRLTMENFWLIYSILKIMFNSELEDQQFAPPT